MPSNRYLMVGLGNPGPKYVDTRHNVGYAVVDQLADQLQVELTRATSQAHLGWGSYQDHSVGLAKPLTYMNRSGRCVASLVASHEISPDRLLVIYDDLNLKLGAIRLRPSGSAGGHNGVRDIIDRLGTREFPRLRIGIGDQYPPGQQSDYVLSPFSRSQRPIIEETVETAAQACTAFVADGLQTAMSRFNRRAG
jgi:PTH1 family peptidyl-tRNA hydrolase